MRVQTEPLFGFTLLCMCSILAIVFFFNFFFALINIYHYCWFLVLHHSYLVQLLLAEKFYIKYLSKSKILIALSNTF